MKIELKKPLAILLLIITTFFWGSTFAFTKELTKELTPLWIVGIRFTTTAFMLLIIFFRDIFIFFKNYLKTALSKKDLILLILLGIINFIAILLQTIGLKYIPASNAGFITSLALLLVPFIEFIFRKRKVNINIKIAVIISLIGIYILSYGFNLPEKFILGDSLVLLCAIFYSIYIIFVDILSKKIHPGVMMFVVFLITGFFSLPLAFIIDTNQFSGANNFIEIFYLFSPLTYFNMFFLIILGTIIPYLFMGIGQRVIDSQTASLIYILEPVFAMLIAILFFGEIFMYITLLGGGLIIIAQIIGITKIIK